MEADFLSAQKGVAPNSFFWIGLADSTRTNQFHWRDGSLATFTKWAPSEPKQVYQGQDKDCSQVGVYDRRFHVA